MSPLHAHTPLHSSPPPTKSRSSGAARGSTPATRSESGTEGRLRRRRRCAEGARPAPGSEARRAQPDAGLGTHRLRGQQVGNLRGPRRSQLVRPSPEPRAPHLPRARALLPRPPATLLEPPPPPPPAARPALARARPPPPPPPLVPAPVPASHWPLPPQATRRRCQWPAGLSLSSAIEQPIYFSPARSPASVSRPGLELSRHIWLAPSGLSGCSPSSQQRPQ